MNVRHDAPDLTFAAVRPLYARWAEAGRHDCDAAEATIDALIAGSREMAGELAERDGAVAHLAATVEAAERMADRQAARIRSLTTLVEQRDATIATLRARAIRPWWRRWARR